MIGKTIEHLMWTPVLQDNDWMASSPPFPNLLRWWSQTVPMFACQLNPGVLIASSFLIVTAILEIGSTSEHTMIVFQPHCQELRGKIALK